MPDFVTFRDNPFRLIDPITQAVQLDIEDEIQPLTGLDTNRDAVLAFNIIVNGFIHLTMNFNDRDPPFIDRTFNAPGPPNPLVWHEVFPGRILNRGPQPNKLHIATSGILGYIEFSDFVLTYHTT
jgi:hypothetical protein